MNAKDNDAQCDQDEYNYVQSLLFNYPDALVPRDNYYFQTAPDGNAWILKIMEGVKIIPRDVFSGGKKGFVFLFKDDMTPRPFDEGYGGWKVTLLNGGLTNHCLMMASPDHTYFRLKVSEDVDEIEALGGDSFLA